MRLKFLQIAHARLIEFDRNDANVTEVVVDEQELKPAYP